MEKSCKEKEQPQSTPMVVEDRPLLGQPPEEHRPKEEQSSEEGFFLQGILPEMLQPKERPPRQRLSRQDLFQEQPPLDQPPGGVGKRKLQEGSFKERLARFCPQFRGDIYGRNLSNEEMIKAADEMEEMKRVRNKLIILHGKAKWSCLYPI
ncbi:PREDICTED: transcription elongation factor A protein-like 1 [Chinchilla lanigera]|uniref:transcription elongation factor A protein-like 1 n=1 Tax=Chinchilla lanigera TaxID=34839 RepID=UPI00038F01AC|nr:PREDICTED: transcription elongation factor A protein-like 1 [Chinchilla lanigera]